MGSPSPSRALRPLPRAGRPQPPHHPQLPDGPGAFARWFEETNPLPLDPAQITATDLREYKRQLLERQRLKPASVNRKLATLKSFLGWVAGAGLTTSGDLPKVHRLERLERLGPRWLNLREQHALLRAVDRIGEED